MDGPAAVDVLQNYSERWRCQASDREQCLLPLDEEEFDVEAPGSGGWNAQFFRSINADSVSFDVNCIQNARSLKGKYYESSIQDAYIYQIRKAKKFIYLENQYFLGSSHWYVMVLFFNILIAYFFVLLFKVGTLLIGNVAI